MEKHKIIVVIPSHNELKTLKKIILSVKKFFPVLIVDDNSNDGTFKFLKEKKINHIRNNKKIGYEKSLIKAFKYVVNNKKEIKNIVTMDADGEHLPSELKKFLKLKNFNLVIGKRRSYNRVIEHIVSYIFVKKFKLLDPLSGFKMYSTQILKNIKKFSSNYLLVDLASNIISINNKKCVNIFVKVKKRDGQSRLNNFFKLYFKMINIILFILFFPKY
ncbi:glycosyltransferase family 2 protein [Candidatus Pelagibacter sp.]|nr:glycosyltransferase family 2 protein [Candidatus Pelagibacter sp.]